MHRKMFAIPGLVIATGLLLVSVGRPQQREPQSATDPLRERLGAVEESARYSYETLLRRKSPLVFATAVREALADTADDAGLPLAAFPSCAFGVVHDAFPSIERVRLVGVVGKVEG